MKKTRGRKSRDIVSLSFYPPIFVILQIDVDVVVLYRSLMEMCEIFSERNHYHEATIL
jgi:hypothetical protein